jgi:uncharacterized protein YkwD
VARIRTLFAAAIAAAVITMFMPAIATAGPRKQMVKTINYARSWGHLRGLHGSSRLSRKASAWARHLIRSNVLYHSRAQGEVIELHTGSSPKVRATVNAWLNSPAHRGVMLSRSFSRVGAGRAVGWMGGRRVTIWVVKFAR